MERSWIALGVALVANSAATLLLKIGATRAIRGPGPSTLIGRFVRLMDVYTALAICLFAANVLVYRKAIETLKISVAYPLMTSCGMVLVITASHFLPQLRERLTAWQLMGVGCVLVGVWLLATKG